MRARQQQQTRAISLKCLDPRPEESPRSPQEPRHPRVATPRAAALAADPRVCYTSSMIHDTLPDEPRRSHWAAIGSVAFALLFLTGCRSLPDVQPFTDATIGLRSAVASSGAAVVGELGQVEITGAKEEVGKLKDAWAERNRLFTALVQYANSIQSIVDAGRGGAAAAQGLADSLQRLANTAGLVQPGTGEAAAIVKDAAVFVWDQIARVRAASSLEKALVAAQPAIERIVVVMGDDLKDLDSLARIACAAQRNGLKQANAVRLAYRERLTGSRDGLFERLNAALAEGKSASQLPEPAELKHLEELLANTDSWYGPLAADLEAISAREQVTRELIAATRSALDDWGAVHARLLTAVRARRLPSAAELVQSAERIRDLVTRLQDL